MIKYLQSCQSIELFKMLLHWKEVDGVVVSIYSVKASNLSEKP